MILQKHINITATRYNTKVLKKQFNNIKFGDEYQFPIEKLSSGSHYEIEVGCDFCDFIRKIMYKEYLVNTKKDGKYYCPKCSIIKMENSKLEKYGNKNYFNEKKYKRTCLEKYGVENAFQNENIKDKIKETCLKKYGNENYHNSDKIKETCLKKYGVDNPSKSLIIKQKKIDTSLKNWGVEHPSQNKEVISRTLETIKNNRTYDLSDYWVYRYKSIQTLNKIRDVVFNNWDGYDYYDGEYIAENFKLSPSDKLYPTIDHKISVYFAYNNNISIEEVSDIKNLCVTKKGNNSRKNRKNENDFIIK